MRAGHGERGNRVEAPPRPGGAFACLETRSGPGPQPGYRYVKIGSPMSIQLKIDQALGIGTRRQPWLAG